MKCGLQFPENDGQGHPPPCFHFLLPGQPMCGQPLTRGTHHSSLDLFQWLQQFGLVINLEKCTFHVKEIEFLGHESVSARGTLPLSSNVEAVQHFPEPATVKACKYSWAWSTFTVASFPMPPACCFPSQTAYVGDCHPAQRCTGHL